MCVCVCIISHPAVPCLSPPFYPCTCLTFRGWGSCSSCVGTHYIYIPCFQSSSNPLSSSLPVRRVYIHVQKSLYPSVCPESRRFFFFFSPRAAFYVIGQFSFFFLQLIASSFFCFIAFFWVCLFVYSLIQNQKEIKSFEILGAARGDMLRL